MSLMEVFGSTQCVLNKWPAVDHVPQYVNWLFRRGIRTEKFILTGRLSEFELYLRNYGDAIKHIRSFQTNLSTADKIALCE